MTSRVWLITGTSSGLGWSFARAALEAGNTVVATARRPEALAPLTAEFGDQVLPLALDVTNRNQIEAVVEQALTALGHIDVVVNNAGFGIAGAVEETSEAQARALMETNFFGALSMIQTVLPHLRQQGSGHIVNLSSIAGVGANPGTGLYSAAKWALEAMSEALAGEVAPFGIKVTVVEPARFRSQWAHGNLGQAEPIEAYDALVRARPGSLGTLRVGRGGPPPPKVVEEGDPDLAARLLVRVVDSPDPPLRLLLGNLAYDVAYAVYERRVALWRQWEAEGRATDSPPSEATAPIRNL